MVKVCLRWCISGIHSGFPYQYDVSETTTIGEICKMVIATNNEWHNKGWAENRYSIIKVCGHNNKFFEDSHVIGGGHHQNECYFVFYAG
jgi:hypothetical protein